MDIALQVWGGTFYLTNKVLLALSENKAPSVKRTFKISGWSAYILGVPAWVIGVVKHFVTAQLSRFFQFYRNCFVVIGAGVIQRRM